MMKRYLLTATPLAAMLLLTGCMDDNYDLSNIDKTTEVNVNGLVLPVNVKDVTLNSVIDLDESGDVKKEIDPATGKEIYVYSYSGDFESDAIQIDPFNVQAPVLTPNEIDVNLASAHQTKRAAGNAVHYKVGELETSFDYKIKDIDPAVKKITALGTPGITFNIAIQFPQAIMANSESVVADNLKIEFPKGLEMAANSPSTGSYDAATGIVTINDYRIQADGKLSLVLVSTKLNIDKEIENGQLEYQSAITVLKGGDLMITPKSGVTLDPSFKLTTDYRLNSFDVTKFSGAVDKPIDGLDINPILLNDLPDFLTGEGTNLRLGNPQLYLQLNNPVSQYHMTAHTGLAITPVRGTTEDSPLELGGGLTIGDNKPAGSIYKYVLSPDGQATTPITGYEDAEKLVYANLGDVLAGDGIPSKLKVTFGNPMVKGNNVTDFPLSSTSQIPGIKGEYKFFAPLALEEGTVIYYSGTKSDWSSEDLDRLHVKEMTVTATASSDIPLSLVLTAQVVTTSGQKVGECEGATLPAMAQDHEITFTIYAPEGTEISNIDGIFYNATCAMKAGDPAAGEAIAPDQKVVLKNVRAKVTGRYLYEDKD